MNVTNTEITSTIREMVADIGEIDDVGSVGLNQHLIEDLGMDSMLLLEVLASLEQTYSISIPESEFANMTTVSACAEVVQRYQSAAA